MISPKQTNINYESTCPDDDVLTLVRKFRWALESNDNILPSKFVKSINFNWVAKTCSIEILEAHTKSENGTKTVSALKWVEDHYFDPSKKFELIFSTFDACGNTIYTKTFKNCNVNTICPVNFNYDDSSGNTIIAGVSFDTWETKIYE